jgi:hypothetical protein
MKRRPVYPDDDARHHADESNDHPTRSQDFAQTVTYTGHARRVTRLTLARNESVLPRARRGR